MPKELPPEVDVVTAAQMLRDGALLLDVREPFELALSTIAGSRHIPMRQIPGALGELPRDRPIIVLCHAGVRSMKVTGYLRANGYSLVSNIAGGIDAWAEQIDRSLARY